jgi:hypothetical protein
MEVDPGLQEMLWPSLFDLGFKWLRLGTCGTLSWGTVERERGVYRVDPVADRLLEQAEANGCRVILSMANHGNRLYAPADESEGPDVKGARPYYETGHQQALLSVTPEVTEAYVRWVRFMASHFRGRISYFEVGNEPAVSMARYREQAKVAIAAIREEAPEAKIMLASGGGIPSRDGLMMPISTWPWYIRMDPSLYEVLDDDLAPQVDALGWHPQECLVTDLRFTFETYPELVQEYQAYCREKGFRGQFLVTEYHDLAADPPASWRLAQGRLSRSQDPRNDREMMTEIQQAKNFARVAVMHAALQVPIMWCEVFPSPFGAWLGQSLFRSPWEATPICPVTPVPLYYVMRNMATLLDGVQPAEIDVRFTLDRPWLDSRVFTTTGKTVIALWRRDFVHDCDPGVESDVSVGPLAGVKKVSGVDTLNGRRLELEWWHENGRVVVPGLRIRDYPLLLELESGSRRASS